MSYQTYPPAPALMRYIKCYWSLTYTDDKEGQAEPAGYSVLAEGVELLFHLTGALVYNENGNASAVLPESALIGPMSKPMQIALEGQGTLWGVCFRPGGASSFVDLPAKLLKNRCLAAVDVLGAKAGERLKRIQDAYGTPKDTIDHLNRFLLCRLRKDRRSGIDPMTIVDAIERSKGQVSIKRLSVLTGISSRGVFRVFEEYVGITPKQLCRSLRFKHVFKHLAVSKVESNAELALTYGYYDQSHLIKDFKYYTGKSPTSFFNTRGAEATFFSENF